MSVNLNKKRTQEKDTITYMITYYCKKKHRQQGICSECQETLTYAMKRIDSCPFMETKTFCSNCHVHCYEARMRDKIKVIMRYAGPRMLFHKPIMAIRHIYVQRKEKT